ncbi:hypothetical protein I2I05_20655 [Hymenobacter sp. BT683]|uniref:Uncharacterized protein n=1 Tax=Hymenobacter jeongseonensis TaxID=2791027 RepID=A0ABS0INR6_9BACT|nr:hypothetical protein [Hymenobacter jeongseonensis]MBF9239817.1 hypothetical protein [Hymenobacter jeongseonensis]
MNKSTVAPLLAALLALGLLPAGLYAQTGRPVRKIRLHAYPYSSSTLIGVDTTQLAYAAALKTTVKHAATFLAALEQALDQRDTIAVHTFRGNFVRFFFKVYYRDGGTRSIYLAQGRTLLYGQRLYTLDNELKHLIRGFIPRADEYLPVRALKK